jgi:uridine phosphorylase
LTRAGEPKPPGSRPAERGPNLLGDLARAGLPRYLLMPGDPERVSLMARQWSKAREHPLPRGFRAATGQFNGVALASLASGMGAPSLELMLTEAVQAGAETIIRVGTTGSLHAHIENGHLIVNEAAVRLDGTTDFYARPEYPAAASYEVTLALVEACERLSVPYHVGIAATTSSFFVGQGRMASGFRGRGGADVVAEMREAGVLNFEMEGSALFVLARLLGVRAGMVTSVIGNRVSGEWADRGGTERACRVAAEAVTILAEWDRLKEASSARSYFPSLGRGPRVSEEEERRTRG